MGPRKNRVGVRCERLVITSYAYTKDGRAYWNAKCDCGRSTIVSGDTIEQRTTKSCGCLLRKHMMSNTKTYESWAAMRERCLHKDHAAYPQYGGRGVKICERWSDFKNFLEDMGERPANKTLDRIDDALIYSKETCRWATDKEQQQNRRKLANCASRFIGVRKWKRKNGFAWGSSIKLDGKETYLGIFKTEEESALAYNVAATAHYGPLAKINKVDL